MWLVSWADRLTLNPVISQRDVIEYWNSKDEKRNPRKKIVGGTNIDPFRHLILSDLS